ncbi:MAG: hypothetical protein OEY86_06445 [Nitrospira sp.]|nr:hypothetical protein [Nitrospira sp.]
MKRMIVEAGLISLVLLVGTISCSSRQGMTQSAAEGSSMSSTSEVASGTASTAFSDSLDACLARIPSGSSEGTRVVAQQSCQENEALRQGVVGTATEKSSGRASSGTQGDSLDACMTRIPKDATEGQRMLAEDSCRRDQAMRR